MKKIERMILSILLLVVLFQVGLNASNKEAFGKIFMRFFEGILQANYREYPFSEVIGWEQAILPEPVFPQNIEHPSLLFDTAELSRLRRQSIASPYTEWLDEMMETALSLPYPASSPLLLEKNRAKAAKLNAFCFAITGQPQFRDNSLLALNHIGEVHKPTTPEGGQANLGWGDWMQAADALEKYAVAYDIMHNELLQEEHEEIKRKLSAMAAQMYNHFTKLPRNISSLELAMGLGIPKNNHIIDIAVGVATISLVLDVPQAETWFKAAYRELQTGLMMIHADGSYREGYYYGMYVAQKLFTFFIYYEKKTGINLFQVPRIKLFTRWLIDLLKEDGTYPLFDDAFPQNIIVFPLATKLSPLRNELRYIVERDWHTYKPSNPIWVEVFCNYEQHLRIQNPYQTELISYFDSGYSVFRGDNELYALFLNQPGRQYLSGHSHIDPLSFLLSAYGKNMLIDAGYGQKGVNDINRRWFVSAQAHNIPLINGQGPNQNPLWGDYLGGKLVASYQSDDFSFARANANYQGADISRHIWFSDKQYFIIIDEVETERRNRISIPWHGKGTILETGRGEYVWQQNLSSLHLEYLTLNNSTLFTTKKGLNTYKENVHNYATATFIMGEEKEKMVSILLPNSLEDRALSSQPYPVLSEGKTEARMLINATSFNPTIFILAEKHWQTDQLKSDAKAAFFSSNSQIDFIKLVDATYLSIENDTIFYANKAVSIFLDFKQEPYKGYVHVPDEHKNPLHISIRSIRKPGVLLVDDTISDFSYENEFVNFAVSESSSFSFGISRTGHNHRIYESYPTLKYINNYQLGSDLRLLSYERKTKLRNEIIAISGKSMLALVDSTANVPNFSEKMYGIASGIFDNLWHADDKFRMSLPQQFKWEQQIGKWQFRYREYGVITDKGITAHEQRFFIEDFFFLQHENYFENHSFTQLELTYSRKKLHAFYETYKRNAAYELQLSGNTNHSFFQLNHRDDAIRNVLKESVRWQSQRLSLQSSYIYRKDEQLNEMNFGFGYREAKNAFHSGFSINDEIGITSGNLSIQNRIHPLLNSTSYMNYANHSDETISVRFHFYSYWKKFVQTMQHRFANNEKWSFAYSLNTRWEKWRIRYNLKKKDDWNNEINAIHRTRNFQFENSIDTKDKYSFSGAYFFNRAWNLNASFNANYKMKKIMSYGLGSGFYNHYSLACKIVLSPHLSFSRYMFDVFMSLPLNSQQLLQIQVEVTANDKFEVGTYEVGIKQRSFHYSPGILFSRDERGFTRYEGYLELFFY